MELQCVTCPHGSVVNRQLRCMDEEVRAWEKEARGLVDVPAPPNPPPPAYSKPLQTQLSLGWLAGPANDEMIAGGKKYPKR